MVKMGTVVAAALGVAGAGAATLLLMPKVIAEGEGRIAVHVLDYQTGTGVAGATVSVDAKTLSTDTRGDAEFKVSPGEYDVVVFKTGCATERTVATVSSGHRVSLTIRLRSETAPPPQYFSLTVTVRGWVDFGSEVYSVTKWVKIRRTIEGLLVSAEGPTPREAYTLADGKATLSGLLDGNYTIKIKSMAGQVLHSVSVVMDSDKSVTIELPTTVSLPKEVADPTYQDVGGGFILRPTKVPVPNGDLAVWVDNSDGSKMDNAQADVFETNDPTVASPEDYRVVSRYTTHNAKIDVYAAFLAWDAYPSCSQGDLSGYFHDYYKSVAINAAVNAAAGHAQSVVTSLGVASFVGEEGYSFPVRIAVRGTGKYLIVRLRTKEGYTSTTILPIAKE